MPSTVEKPVNHRPLSWRKTIEVLALVIGWFLIGWFSRDFFIIEDGEAALLRQAQEAIAEKYFGQAPEPRQMTYAALRGILADLGDPYAVFHEPAQAASNQSTMSGNAGVIGVRGEMRSGQFVFTYLSPGGAAERSGLQVGDILLEIDGWLVPPDAAYMDVMSLVRGQQGSTAQMVVLRGEDRLEFTIKRQAVQEVITQTSVEGIAYLRFDGFTEKTPQAVEQALQDLLSQGAQGLIIDLRYNGGGLMVSTQAVLDLFLGEGVAFYAQTKDGEMLPFATKSGDIGEQIPLALLIGPDTYSAPETLAASIADRNRGVLIGETTYGKGAIRETVFLFDGSSMQFTAAHWLSPVRQESFEGRGVPPDIMIRGEPGAQGDPVMDTAIEYLKP